MNVSSKDFGYPFSKRLSAQTLPGYRDLLVAARSRCTSLAALSRDCLVKHVLVIGIFLWAHFLETPSAQT